MMNYPYLIQTAPTYRRVGLLVGRAVAVWVFPVVALAVLFALDFKKEKR